MTTPRRRGKPVVPQGPKLTANISKADTIRMGSEVWKRDDARAVRMKTILRNPQAERQVLIKGAYRG